MTPTPLDHTALLLIDYQAWIVDRLAPAGGPAAAVAGHAAAELFRAADRPVIHVQYLHLDGSDGGAGSPLTRFVAPLRVRADEAVITKYGRSAFDGTPLADLLAERGIDHLVIGGLLTEGGVLSTGLDALRAGIRTDIHPDACAGASIRSHDAALAALDRAGAGRWGAGPATPPPR